MAKKKKLSKKRGDTRKNKEARVEKFKVILDPRAAEDIAKMPLDVQREIDQLGKAMARAFDKLGKNASEEEMNAEIAKQMGVPRGDIEAKRITEDDLDDPMTQEAIRRKNNPVSRH